MNLGKTSMGHGQWVNVKEHNFNNMTKVVVK